MAALLEQLYESGISTAIRDTGFVIPAVQSIHILSISVLLGAALVGDLKALGCWKAGNDPLPQVRRRFRPWIVGAFAAILVSGAINALGEPVRVFGNWLFWTKMGLLVLAFALSSLVGRAMAQASSEPLTVLSLPHRAMAVLSIATWGAIIVCGRWIAYVAS